MPCAGLFGNDCDDCTSYTTVSWSVFSLADPIGDQLTQPEASTAWWYDFRDLEKGTDGITLHALLLACGDDRLGEILVEAGFDSPCGTGLWRPLGSALAESSRREIGAIHRSCGLNDSQTKKLELAGRGEIKRLIDGIAEHKQAFLSEERDNFAASRYLYESAEVLALRKKLRDGPFGEDSLFAKTIGNVLTPDQAAKYAKRSALAAGSNRTITPASVADLVRIAQIQKDVYRVAWDRDGKHVGCLEYNKQLDVYLPLADQPVRTIGQGTKVLGFDFGPHADLLATVDSAANVTSPQLSRREETRNTNWSESV